MAVLLDKKGKKEAVPDVILPPITFPTLGWEVIEWIEAMLCHGRGDVQGQTIALDDEECSHICWCYRLQPKLLRTGKDNPIAGRRLVDRAVYVRSKGARKSEMSAMLSCAEALGPVRFDGWDANGNPVGRVVTDPRIRVMATEEGQSSNVWDHITYMLSQGRVADEYAIDLGRSPETSTRIILRTPEGGELLPSTSGAGSKVGGRETFVVADEGHLYVTAQLKKMYQSVVNNTVKRKASDSWMHQPTNAWQEGERSIIETDANQFASMPIEEAVTKFGVLFDHRRGKEPAKFGDDNSLKKALRWAYAPSKHSWTDFDKMVRSIRTAEDPEAEAYRNWLSLPRKGTSQWLTPSQIKAVLGKVDVKPGTDEAICAGFDGSESDDHTVLHGCRENGDLFTIGMWMPGQLGAHWEDDVDEAVEWMFDNFRVLRFYADPARWQAHLAEWARLHGSPPVTEFWTGERNLPKMAMATGALKTEITSEAILIDPEPLYTEEIFMEGVSLLEWHLSNARQRKRKLKIEDVTEDTFVLGKERMGGPLKIDGSVGCILARRARDDAYKEQEFDEGNYGVAVWQ